MARARLLPGCIGAWALDTPGIAFDKSPYSRNLTLAGSIASPAFGKRGFAQKFSGSTAEMVRLPIDAVGRAGLSVSIWLYPTDSAASYKFAVTESSTFSLGTYGNSYRVAITDGLGTTDSQTVGTVDFNAWQHLVWRFKGTTFDVIKNGSTVVYSAGSKVSPIGADAYTDGALYLGGFRQSSTNYLAWIGSLSQLQIFDRGISDSEIVELYRSGFAVPSRRVVVFGAAAGGPTTTTIAPSKGSLAVAGYAPGVVRTANQAVTPTLAHATITGKQPAVAQSSAVTVAPTKGAATIAGRTPGIDQDIGVAPTIGHLTATGRQPGITQNVTSFIAPSKGALTATGKQPALEQTANQTIAPSKGVAYLAGYAPVVEIAGGSQILLPDKGTLTLTGYAPEVSTGGELGGKPVFARRRKRYLVKDRVYDDLDPADVIAAAAEVGIDLGDVREVVKEPTQQKSAPRRADDEGREYWLPQEFWGRAAARQKLEATAPLGNDFQRAVEAIRASAGPMQARMALRQRQEEA
jgi:hypothetical protein